MCKKTRKQIMKYTKLHKCFIVGLFQFLFLVYFWNENCWHTLIYSNYSSHVDPYWRYRHNISTKYILVIFRGLIWDICWVCYFAPVMSVFVHSYWTSICIVLLSEPEIELTTCLTTSISAMSRSKEISIL